MTIARKLQQASSFASGGTAGLYPAYPAMPSGWQLQAQQIDTSTDQGWTYTNGVRNTDASYNRQSQVTFGVGPTADAMCITCAPDPNTPNGVASADMQAKFCAMPDVHIIEYYNAWPQSPGSWGGGLWERPLSGGEGEIDWAEWMGGPWSRNPTDPQRFHLNAIVTPYSSPLLQDPATLKIDGQAGTPLVNVSDWHHYRCRKTTTDVTVWIDGVERARITRGPSSVQASSGNTANYSVAQWDANFAAGHTWYARWCYQWGQNPNTGQGNAGSLSELPLSTYMRDIRIWVPTA